MPLREDIDPLEAQGASPNHLPDRCTAGDEFRFRQLGSEIVERYARNSTGKTVRETYRAMPDIVRWCTQMFRAVIDSKRPRAGARIAALGAQGLLQLRDDQPAAVARRRASRHDLRRGARHRPAATAGIGPPGLRLGPPPRPPRNLRILRVLY